jgi:hypothetical protein
MLEITITFARHFLFGPVAAPSKTVRRRGSGSVRPTLESLEERVLPAIPTVAAPIAVAAAGSGAAPLVTVYDSATGNPTLSFLAFDAAFTGGVRVAVGDVTGSGTPDIVTGAGPGGGPNIRVFDGRTGQPLPGPLGSFMAFNSAFTGGVFVAVGDVNGDGHADIIAGADAGGGPMINVFSGLDGTLLESFYAFDPSFAGGVRVAFRNAAGNIPAAIIAGAGTGGGPEVSVFNAASATLLDSFFAYNAAFTGGVFVASGDVSQNGNEDIVTGPGSGGGPTVSVFNGQTGQPLSSFMAFDSSFSGGVTVGTIAALTSGGSDILAAAGPGGGPNVREFTGNGQPVAGSLGNVMVGGAAAPGGLFVAGEYPAAVASPQPSNWSWLANTSWYVPAGNLLAYITGPLGQANQPIDDQTIFSIQGFNNGFFWGETTVQLSAQTDLGGEGTCRTLPCSAR